jgi:LmbE family N-acetylglucosaminyl deacetylase
MKPFSIATKGEPLRVLALGAHSDDIEIGCGGAILEWIAVGARVDITWCVFSAAGVRAEEATRSASEFLQGAAETRLVLGRFPDSRFPGQSDAIKSFIEEIRTGVTPDVVLTHRRDDAHQDHREIAALTWNAFRNHLILEYEIPKWDGDLGQPNFYLPMRAETLERKIALLHRHFGTQRSKDWFDDETFRGLARLRGMECRAPERYAEGFTLRKAIGC